MRGRERDEFARTLTDARFPQFGDQGMVRSVNNVQIRKLAMSDVRRPILGIIDDKDFHVAAFSLFLQHGKTFENAAPGIVRRDDNRQLGFRRYRF